MIDRVFLIVLDSFGIGAMPDAEKFGDEGSDTLGAICSSPYFCADNLKQLGLFNIEGVTCAPKAASPTGCFARLEEKSAGKDTTVGHWELAGIVSDVPFLTFPSGFPNEIIDELISFTGRGVLCNAPYSGTEVIRDYGREHIATGDLIVYTSADSVLQIAAHEDVVPVADLYKYCEAARKILDTHGLNVARVIARPFSGKYPNFIRTPDRHDFSAEPPEGSLLQELSSAGCDVIGVGKINDIFCGKGLTETVKTTSNRDGIEKTLAYEARDFKGLCFVNLVDFDSKYGHRNDVDGYARAISEFDASLPDILGGLKENDLLMITADHGCDPSTPSTDHSREYVPLIAAGRQIKNGVDLGTIRGFDCVASTVAEIFGVKGYEGKSFLNSIYNDKGDK